MIRTYKGTHIVKDRIHKKLWMTLVGVVAAVIFGLGLPALISNNEGTGSSSQQSRGSLGVALAAPPSQEMSAFPKDKVGFSAYIDVGTLIKDQEDLATLTSICQFPTISFDSNSLLCVVANRTDLIAWGGNTFSGGIAVEVVFYADVDGSLVAFLWKNPSRGTGPHPNMPMSFASKWSGSADDPVLVSPVGALDDVLMKAIEAIGLNLEELEYDIGYYHWQHPQATSLTVISKTSDTEEGGAFQFSIPGSARLFEVSMSVYGQNAARVYLNGGVVAWTGTQYQDQPQITYHGSGYMDTNRLAHDSLHRIQADPGVGSAIYLLTGK